MEGAWEVRKVIWMDMCVCLKYERWEIFSKIFAGWLQDRIAMLPCFRECHNVYLIREDGNLPTETEYFLLVSSTTVSHELLGLVKVLCLRLYEHKAA